ncbi:MAG: phage terminase large subunit family protein [Nitrospira sp.]|nr:MAG: phage terminase large subunit family protein [Nitrospira sp.]
MSASINDDIMTRCIDTACYTRAANEGFLPDPDETVDAWSDAHVELPSLVAEPGRWRTERTPFLREIMECLSPSHDCQFVVLMKCVQIGGTQVGVNWIGYIIHRAPGAMLVFEPTKDLAKKLSKEKVSHMIELTACLKDRVKDPRSRDSGNNTFTKEFKGGFVNFIGCNSAVGMRSTSARYVMIDEVDGCPKDVNGEGHPADLAENRTVSFPNRKIFKLSTPLEAQTSRIEPDYKAGSRGRYHVPCPFCNHFQHLQWGQIVFTFDGIHVPDRAAYQCESCQVLIPEYHKGDMLARGKWMHEDPENPVRSFHINALYQPYGWTLSWRVLAEKWLVANEEAKRGDVRKLKYFINTILAQTWEEKGEKADEDELYKRRELYEAPCPMGVLVLTAAVDLQDNRIEAEIDGWGLDEENWSIAKHVFPGSPAQPMVWKDLTDWLQRKWMHACGIALRVECVVVDTGGHHTKQAYWYVRKYRGRCYAIKGSNQSGAPLVPPRPTKPKGASVHLYHVGTTAAKDTIFGRLMPKEDGAVSIHFPVSDDYDREHFRQLAAEEKRKIYDKGVEKGYHYVKIRARNEALDLKVYNLAAMSLLNPNFEKLAEKMKQPRQIELGDEAAPAAPAPAVVSPQEPAPDKPKQADFVKQYNQPRRHGGGFVKGWR